MKLFVEKYHQFTSDLKDLLDVENNEYHETIS
jgi:hypothetical protein